MHGSQPLQMGGHIDDRVGRELRQMTNGHVRMVHSDCATDVERSAVDCLIHQPRTLAAHPPDHATP
jgi:hypothetical protein